MKKLIAIAVVFALVMGGVFAEINVGGSAWGKVYLGQGITGDKTTVDSGSGFQLKASGQNDDGTFGGEFGFEGDTWLSGGNTGGNIHHNRSNVWWKPLDLLKIQLGSGLDGSFGLGDANTGWGFYKDMNDMGLWEWDGGWDVPGKWDFDGGFNGTSFGGSTNMGLYLSVNPFSGLEVNMIFPFLNGKDQTPEDVYKLLYAEVGYNIDGIGKVKAGFKSNYFDYEQTGNNIASRPGRVGIAFDLSALQAMGLDMAVKLHTGIPTANVDWGVTDTFPLNVAFGVGFTAGDFNTKLRFNGEFLGKRKYEDPAVDDDKRDAFLQFGIYPNYTVGNLFVGVGFDLRVENINDDPDRDSTIRWHASPHIKYSVGSGSFRAGLNVGVRDLADKDKLRWEVPIHIGIGF